MNGRIYVEYNLVLSYAAVQTLSSCNDAASPLKNESHDLKFIRLMVIALYTSGELSAKTFPPEKRNMMERFFAIRADDSEERKVSFNKLFSIALKEAIVRNSKNSEKLKKIQLPDDIFGRKKGRK